MDKARKIEIIKQYGKDRLTTLILPDEITEFNEEKMIEHFSHLFKLLSIFV